MIHKIIILIILNIAISQTNITTPMGSTGFGIWTTINQAFKVDETISSVVLDLHLNFGLELLVGKSISTNVDYSFNQFGIAYDLKLFDWGSKFYCKRYDIDDFDFSSMYEKEELGLEIYKRGWKLNSFIRINQYTYNPNSNYNLNENSVNEFITLGGVGRMTRFATYGFGIKMPFDKLFHMRYSSVEATFGTSF
tara:strand:- start:604 stop:1185 length:582 start_codon:yes stop_codon:yes gene_type:complete